MLRFCSIEALDEFILGNHFYFGAVSKLLAHYIVRRRYHLFICLNALFISI